MRNVSTPNSAPSSTSDRPSVTVSYAQTLDGRLATRSGSSQWISGPESLRFAHELRAAHDAIMVGIGTVLRDDPHLTVRLVDVPRVGAQPLRVIVDSTLRTPPTANVLANGAAPGTLIACTQRAPEARRAALIALGAQVLMLPADAAGGADLVALLHHLGEFGIGSVMVEGGARLITGLLRRRLVDRLAVCVAPKMLGSGIDAIGDLGIVDLAQALRLHEPRLTRYGVDFVLDGTVVYPEEFDGP